MTDSRPRRLFPRAAAGTAVVLGLGAGSYGVAAAATDSAGATTTTTAQMGAPPGGGQPWGRQRTDETPLTGDALAKVTAIAKDKVPGGTVIRVETDADGNAAYEAHMTNAAGTPVTVYVDKSFSFVRVETR
jgi:hypothetical protein